MYWSLFRWCCLVDVNKEVTVAIIKPDAVKAGLAESIIQEVRTLLSSSFFHS